MTRLILIVISVLHLAACSYFNDSMADFSMDIPKLPEEYGNLEVNYYQINIAWKNHQETFTASSSESRLKVKVPIDQVSAVLVTPYCPSMELKPAGTIITCPGNQNYLSWDMGFAAYSVYQVIRTGTDLDDFNFQKFQDKAMEISNGNPWLLDNEKIIYGLSYHIFNASCIKLSATHTLSLDFLGLEGVWYRNTPGNPGYFIKKDNILENLELSPGENIFYYPEENVSLTIFAGDLGWIGIFSDSTGGLSGNW